MAHRSYREESRRDWGRVDDGVNITMENVRDGAILRIADAVEKMARRYDELISDRDLQRERAERNSARAARLERSNAALRGHLKRAKAALKGE